MTILVTAASGQLGRLVVDALLARGAEPADVIAAARRPAALADLAQRGVRTVELDYTEPVGVAAAMAAVDAVLLISGNAPGARLAGHLNVIDAAVAAGVSRLVYTSAPKATTFDWPLGADHRATEQAIAASGLPAVILRNNWYTENYLPDVQRARETGVIAAAVGDARVASACRRDYAEAAAVVLLEKSHAASSVHELGGDVAWTYTDLAAAASEVLGREVHYLPLTPGQQAEALAAAGLSGGYLDFVQARDAGIAGGVLADSDGTLSRLIGRATTPLVDGLREGLAAA